MVYNYSQLRLLLKGEFGQKFPVDMLNLTAWERHYFLPSQDRTKIDREPLFQTCKFVMFWKKIRVEFRCLNTTAWDSGQWLHVASLAQGISKAVHFNMSTEFFDRNFLDL